MSQNPGMPLNSGVNPSVTTCSNCHTPMPRELRFCRNCGFRLGEGLAEYTETVRFQNQRPPSVSGNGAASSQPFATTYGLSGGPIAVSGGGQLNKRRRRMSGMTWMFLALLIFFIGAGAFTALVTPIRRGVNVGIVKISPPRSYAGVNSFDTTNGGVTFDNVEPPGSPADKAGLVGGDVITTFDGRIVHSE